MFGGEGGKAPGGEEEKKRKRGDGGDIGDGGSDSDNDSDRDSDGSLLKLDEPSAATKTPKNAKNAKSKPNKSTAKSKISSTRSSSRKKSRAASNYDVDDSSSGEDDDLPTKKNDLLEKAREARKRLNEAQCIELEESEDESEEEEQKREQAQVQNNTPEVGDGVAVTVAPPSPVEEAPLPPIMLILRENKSSTVTIASVPNKPLLQVVKDYCEKKGGIEVESVGLEFDGDSCDLQKSPNFYEMEDEDQVEVSVGIFFFDSSLATCGLLPFWLIV